MTTVMPVTLFKLQLNFPDFILHKDHPLPTMWEPCLLRGRLQTEIFGFSQKETGAKGVAMATI